MHIYVQNYECLIIFCLMQMLDTDTIGEYVTEIEKEKEAEAEKKKQKK